MRCVVSGTSWVSRTIWLLLLLVAGAARLALAAGPSAPLRVVTDDNYPPYVFRGGSGELRGILVDHWRLWTARTGRPTNLTGMDWNEAIRRFEAGEFDVLDTVFRTPQRELRYDFTRPYARIDVPLFFDQSVSGINSAQDLGGLVVAAKAGDAVLETLARSGVHNVVTYPSYERLIAAAAAGQVRVFTVDGPPAHYFLTRMGVADRFRESPPLYTGQFHRAVLKGRVALLREVQGGFDRISPAELRGIDERWMGSPVTIGGLWRQYRYPVLALIAAWVLLSGWLWSLRRTVAHRTGELRAEVVERAAKEQALADSQERLATIFNTVHEAIFIHDVEGRILDVNQAVTELFGVSRDEALALTVRDFSAEDSPLLELRERWGRALSGESSWFEWQARRPRDGQLLPVEVSLRGVTLGGQALVLASVRDIAQRKRAEAERDDLESQLAQSQKMEAIGRLAGGVAHDFNNLLTVILGHCDDLLEDSGQADTRCEEIVQIRTSALRAADLTRQLLAFSRRQTLRPEPLDLGLVVLDMERMLRRLIGEDIELVTEIGAVLRSVTADRGQLERVIMNLAVNARDAMEAGGRLSLSVSNEPLPDGQAALPPGDYVTLIVADTGHGMDESTRQHVFEPFFTTKEKTKGTGLGLSTVLGIVKQSGGEIVCHSALGAGTRFVIYLPANNTTTTAAVPRTSPGSAVAGRGEHVLLVEDDDAVRRLTQRQLERLGFAVTAVADGREALAAFDALPQVPDLVLSDVVMPGMNGMALLREMASRRPGLRVLLMSGYTDDAIGRSGVLDPTVPFLSKPFGSAELLAKVRAAIDGDPPPLAARGPESSREQA
ncbi:MAG: transporter substrate-binding domain-containing protein [Armatimonadetes bacterium]|nr:transporter substrate-binding domain-containing protein [Armatimonadota bacterium]